MNKYIKRKKTQRLLFKKFNKKNEGFLKEYPRLYPICVTYGISKEEVDTAWIRVKNYLNKEEFEIAARMLIVCKIKHHAIKENSRADFYNKMFKDLGVNF